MKRIQKSYRLPTGSLQMDLSALDQSPVFSNQTSAEALQNTLECAIACEKLGLKRYWVAEHHNSRSGARSFAGNAPEVLMPALAARTNTIRVGSGGVMLNHYSPLKVAECFSLMATLFPDRIDLGIGRAPGGDPLQAGALAYGSKTTGADFYPTKVADLTAWINGEAPTTEAFRRIQLVDSGQPRPEIWQLASSQDGALYAAHFGLPLALAHFINPECTDYAQEYRKARAHYNQEHSPVDSSDDGRIILAVFAICAETEAEARQLAQPAALWRNQIQRGLFGQFATTEEAAIALQNKPAAENERALIGTPEQLRSKLQKLVEKSDADELMVVTICEPIQARIKSYSLLQETVSAISK
ncbi:MAG: LLM class flavin-dependent oxidoreductase [Gammaproteobacteria bacterium]